MTALALVRRLWQHVFWADDLLVRALDASAHPPDEVWREYAHILGAEEVWLARLDGRATRAAVWPVLTPEEAEELRLAVRKGYAALLDRLGDAALDEPLTYRNTAGAEFTNTVGDILSHVALHGQYHRGKINLLLRQQGLEPAPADFISFARGAPAAVTPRG